MPLVNSSVVDDRVHSRKNLNLNLRHCTGASYIILAQNHKNSLTMRRSTQTASLGAEVEHTNSLTGCGGGASLGVEVEP